ncbi:hypothetical protein ACVXHB_30240 [Escherichia coli]
MWHTGVGRCRTKTTLLKLRQVYARASARDSQISDESDSREPAFFQRQLLVSFEKKMYRRHTRLRKAKFRLVLNF